MIERGRSQFGLNFRDYCPPAYPGSMDLPPVICRTFTGMKWADGMKLEDIRPEFLNDLSGGNLDAPLRLPAGSHCSPRITRNGVWITERPHSIFPREVFRS